MAIDPKSGANIDFLSPEQQNTLLGIREQQGVTATSPAVGTVTVNGQQFQKDTQGNLLNDQGAVVSILPSPQTTPFPQTNIDKTPDSEQVAESMGNVVTQEDITRLLEPHQKELDRQRLELIAAMQPSEEELATKQELADLQAQIKTQQLGAKAGLSAISDKVIPTKLIQGQQGKLVEQANLQLQTLAASESNLLTRLGMHQEDRELKTKIAQVGLEGALDDIDLKFKIFNTVAAERDSFFAKANQMTDNARQALGIILGQLEGSDPDTLDLTTKNSLRKAATKAGIPLDVLLEGLKVQHDMYEFNRFEDETRLAIAQSQERRLQQQPEQTIGSDVKLTTSDKNKAAAAGIDIFPKEIQNKILRSGLSQDEMKKLAEEYKEKSKNQSVDPSLFVDEFIQKNKKDSSGGDEIGDLIDQTIKEQGI